MKSPQLITCLSAIAVVCTFTCAGQDDRRSDSLELELNGKSDSSKVVLLLELADLLDNAEPRKALDLALQALDLSKRPGCEKFRPEVESEIIFLYRRPLVDFPRAIEHARSLWDIARKLGNERYRADALMEMGIIFNEMGDHPRAILHLDSSLRICRRTGYGVGVGDCMRWLASSYAAIGDTSTTSHILEQAIGDMSDFRDSTQLCGALIDLARFKQRVTDTVTASELLLRAIRIAQVRSRPETLISHGETGRVQFHVIDAMIDLKLSMNDGRSARHYADSLLLQARSWGNRGQLLKAHRRSGQALGMDDRWRSAVRQFELSLVLATELRNPKEEVLCLEKISSALEKIGDQSRAVICLKRLAFLRDSLARTEKDLEAARLVSRVEYGHRIMADSLEHAHELELSGQELHKQKLVRNGFVGGFTLVAVFAAIVLFQRTRIGKEKKRSDELLLNILPSEVAEELKTNGEAKAREFDRVTILFTDFKGFTGISEKLTANELVAELNACFKAFDNIITAKGIEKIKTIGDAYMAAGGLPVPDQCSAADVVLAGLEMQDFMIARKTDRDARGLPAFEMRVGIHTGPVVAGIVGVKKFAYDIWGDTVNIASRMESAGEIGRVNISERTWVLVQGSPGLAFTPRGKVSAKGKGELEMFFVQRIA